MYVHDLDTPALVIDLDIYERNLCNVAEYCRMHGLQYRPHVKTHKIPELARAQIEAGACGITVAKVGEAEVMAAAGLEDLLVAYPVIGPVKLDRLMQVAQKARVSVSLDSEAAARGIAQKAAEHGVVITLFVEVDVGLHRCGVQPGEPAVQLARLIQELPSVRFGGLMYYPGHIKGNPAQREQNLQELKGAITGLLSLFQNAGIPVPAISGGSTPTLYQSHLLGKCVTEIRPGTSLFNDRSVLELGACTLDDCAARVLCTVVSTSVPRRMMIDGGSKTFTSDRVPVDGVVGFGRMLDDPDLQFIAMNEEHGYIDTTKSRLSWKVGDRVSVLMNHICVAMNMQETVYGVRGEKVETVWNVAARGKLR